MDGNKGTLEIKYLSLTWKLGLHPSTLAHLSNIPGSLPKCVLLGPQWSAMRPLPFNRLL
jgi:hypothetical protein